MTEFESFGPVAAPDAEVLILGSMPSVESSRQNRYYAHPQNLFWRFMGELFGAGPDLPYPQRLRALQRARVALWDVAHRCTRTGSADSTIADVEPNDIAALLDRCPKITRVFCNGRRAHQLFESLVRSGLGARANDLVIDYLPSTSPANASMARDERYRTWHDKLKGSP